MSKNTANDLIIEELAVEAREIASLAKAISAAVIDNDSNSFDGAISILSAQMNKLADDLTALDKEDKQ